MSRGQVAMVLMAVVGTTHIARLTGVKTDFSYLIEGRGWGWLKKLVRRYSRTRSWSEARSCGSASTSQRKCWWSTAAASVESSRRRVVYKFPPRALSRLVSARLADRGPTFRCRGRSSTYRSCLSLAFRRAGPPLQSRRYLCEPGCQGPPCGRLRTGGVGQGGAPAAKRGRTTLTDPRAGAGSMWAGWRRRGGAQRYLGARRTNYRRRQHS